MGEHGAAPFVEVSLGPERSRRDPRVSVDTDLLGESQATGAVALDSGDHGAVAHDLE